MTNPNTCAEAEADEPESDCYGLILPWPRKDIDGTPLGIDLAAPGIQHKRLADDVRAIFFAALGSTSNYVEGEDVLQDVYRRILMRNRRASAFDPRRASFSKYVNVVSRGAIVEALDQARRHASARVDVDDDGSGRGMVHAIDMRDPIGAWERAQYACEMGIDIELSRENIEVSWRDARARSRNVSTVNDVFHDALDRELLEYIAAETAAGRLVPRSDLAGMLGMPAAVVATRLYRLARAGYLVARWRGSRREWSAAEPMPQERAA